MRRLALTFFATATLLTGAAQAQITSDEMQSESQDRLMIVNGNSGRVVYDDGRDDLYCVTRRYTAAYDYYGRPIRRRSMNCR